MFLRVVWVVELIWFEDASVKLQRGQYYGSAISRLPKLFSMSEFKNVESPDCVAKG